jgi:hypothetical protein
MTHHIRRVAKITLGVLLLILGVIGLALPVVPRFLPLGDSRCSLRRTVCKALLEYVERRVGWRNRLHQNRSP